MKKIITTIIAVAAMATAQAEVEESDYVDFTDEAKVEMEATQVPDHVMAKIQRQAERDWPDDYIWQEMVIEEQIKAYQRLHGFDVE